MQGGNFYFLLPVDRHSLVCREAAIWRLLGRLPSTYIPYRFPRAFGDEFGDEFGDSLNLVSKLVTHLVMISVNHRIW